MATDKAAVFKASGAPARPGCTYDDLTNPFSLCFDMVGAEKFSTEAILHIGFLIVCALAILILVSLPFGLPAYFKKKKDDKKWSDFYKRQREEKQAAEQAEAERYRKYQAQVDIDRQRREAQWEREEAERRAQAEQEALRPVADHFLDLWARYSVDVEFSGRDKSNASGEFSAKYRREFPNEAARLDRSTDPRVRGVLGAQRALLRPPG